MKKNVPACVPPHVKESPNARRGWFKGVGFGIAAVFFGKSSFSGFLAGKSLRRHRISTLYAESAVIEGAEYKLKNAQKMVFGYFRQEGKAVTGESEKNNRFHEFEDDLEP